MFLDQMEIETERAHIAQYWRVDFTGYRSLRLSGQLNLHTWEIESWLSRFRLTSLASPETAAMI